MAVEFECVKPSTRSVTEMFDLARNIDVHQASQANSNETATHGVVTGLIGLGQQVTWKARHLGIPFSMTSQITAFDAPHRFVDKQVRSPFKSFHHTREFRSTDGGSVMIHRKAFVAPFGLLGQVVEKARAQKVPATAHRRARAIPSGSVAMTSTLTAASPWPGHHAHSLNR